MECYIIAFCQEFIQTYELNSQFSLRLGIWRSFVVKKSHVIPTCPPSNHRAYPSQTYDTQGFAYQTFTHKNIGFPTSITPSSGRLVCLNYPSGKTKYQSPSMLCHRFIYFITGGIGYNNPPIGRCLDIDIVKTNGII